MKNAFSILTIICLTQILWGQERLLESFDSESSLSNWTIYKADGVDVEISSAPGYQGSAVRLDYNFTKGTGYGGIQRHIPLELPENYQFTFYIKAESPGNNLEIKFLDSTGQNVWWVNNRDFAFPSEWKKIKIKKRHITFAWGPADDHSLKWIDKIEFTIASYSGGKGSVWIDELKFDELPPEDNSLIHPIVTVSSISGDNLSVKNISDGRTDTEWKSGNDDNQNIILNLSGRKEFGGIVIDWDSIDYAKKFNVYLTRENEQWEKVYSVNNTSGYKSYIRLKEEDAAFIKIELLKSSNGKGYGIKEISVKNVAYSE